MTSRRNSIANVRGVTTAPRDAGERALERGRLDVEAIAKNRGISLDDARRVFKSAGQLGRRKSRAAGSK